MNCPNCQTICAENDRFCYRCGAPLLPESTPKKATEIGTHWIPALILLIMAAIGLLVYFTCVAPASPPAINSLSDTPWFSVSDGCLDFYPAYYHGSNELTVPDEVDGQTVTSLASYCFSDCTALTTVILPDTLTGIGEGAFSGCTALRGIYVPDSVSEIGRYAFYACTNLEAICIPESVAHIGEAAFYNCDSLSYILYSGYYSDWLTLYSEFINPYTGVFCEDGDFYQGGDPSAAP